MPTKTTEPPKPSSAVADLFGAKAPKAKPSKGKVHPEVDFPPELADLADIVAAARKFFDIVEKKKMTAEAKCKAYMRKWWADTFVETGHRPAMATFHGNEGQFGFLQTSRIYLTDEKLQACKMMGVDIEEAGFVTQDGININMEAIERLGYKDKLMELVQELVGDKTEHIAQIFTPQVKVKDGILEALPGLAKESLQDGEDLASKLAGCLDALGAVNQLRKAEIDKSPTECFELIMNTDIKSDKA